MASIGLRCAVALFCGLVLLAPPARAAFLDRTDRSPPYRLYVPDDGGTAPMPLVVMLHGCGQSASVFADDTRMNELAEAESFAVLYPEQTTEANGRRCWNWFRPENWTRTEGEAAAIVGLIDAVSTEIAIDPGRVHAAGLSAGAAMSVVLGTVFPGRFAAVASVAGLAFGIADDCPSAFNAMLRIRERFAAGAWWQATKDWGNAAGFCAAAWEWTPPIWFLPAIPAPDALGSSAFDAMGDAARVVPTIVFQGTADTLVRPENATTVTGQLAQTADLADDGRDDDSVDAVPEATADDAVPGGRRYRVEDFEGAAGSVVLRVVTVEGMGHSWPGGIEAGSESELSGPATDPLAPDASRMIWRFFEAHPRP